MKEHPSLRKEMNTILRKEGLRYEGEIKIEHLLQVLYHEIRIERIKEKVEKTFRGLNIAAQYGCHILRPSQVVQFDDPVAPSIFDQLVEVTGAESIDYPMRLECCGAPLWGVNDELSMDLTLKKLTDGKQSGAAYLCAACPYCHLQFDTVQKMILSQRSMNHALPSILYPQLLGLSMGIGSEVLGLKMNQVPIMDIEKLLTEKMELPEQDEKVARGKKKDDTE